jgi:hypothetical protein
MSPASFSVSALFVATVVAVAGVFVAFAYFAFSKSWRAALLTALGIAAWLAISWGIASNGSLAFRGSGPPPLARMVLALTVFTALLAFSPVGARISASLPLGAIVGFQVFRIPVEIVLAALHHEGLVPGRMTYEGMNYDIVSGLSAVVIALLAMRGALPRWGLWVWNVGAMVLLVTIVVIANLSTPGPFQIFTDGPKTTILFTAPYVWLPGFLVPSALFGHLLVFRRLFLESKRRAATA